MDFNLISPQSIYFGKDKADILPSLAENYKSEILVVLSKSASKNPKVKSIIEKLKSQHKVFIFDDVSGEPTVSNILKCVKIARENDIELIISIGGGSVIDTAKATAGFAPNDGELTEYIEGVGCGRVLVNKPIDHIAVPTTSGTGSEMTKNAVIMGEGDLVFKRSFRHDKMVPVAAVVDPTLITTVPQKTTAYSGMDAITQLIESYISKKSKPMTDALALEALSKVKTSLVDAYNDGNNIEARTNMAYVSMISGICLANSGLGAVHGIAAGLGAVCHAPHGMVCAILLSSVMKKNAPHIPQEKSAKLCNALTGSCTNNHGKDINTVLGYIDNLVLQLNIPSDLSFLDMDDDTKNKVLSKVSGSSMSGNPYVMSDDEILDLLK